MISQMILGKSKKTYFRKFSTYPAKTLLIINMLLILRIKIFANAKTLLYLMTVFAKKQHSRFCASFLKL